MTRYIPYNSRLLVLFKIITFCNILFNGCFSLKEATIIDDPELKVYKIETNKNELISFKENILGYATIMGDKIISIKINGEWEIYQL